MDKEEKLKILTSQEVEVTQHGGTETPFQNKYWDNAKEGGYKCKVCGALLFESGTKLNSSTGPLGHWGFADGPHLKMRYLERYSTKKTQN